MLGMEDQAVVEYVAPQRRRLYLSQHVEEVFRESQVVARWNILVPIPQTRPGCDDRRQFGHEPDCRPIVVLDVLNIPAWIEHAQSSDSSLQGVHGMPLFGKAFQQVDNLKLDTPVMDDVLVPSRKLRLSGKVSKEQEISGFKIGRSQAKFF